MLRGRLVLRSKFGVVLISSVLLLFRILLSQAQVSVLTQHNDNTRSGTNLQEKLLNISNVNRNTFGRLARRVVDGNIYAQPLIVAQAQIPNRKSTNVAIVATENNSVYGFDAEDTNPRSTTAQIWRTNLGPAVPTSTLYAALNAPYCTDMTLQVGITSTPAIKLTQDAAPRSGVIFTAAKTKRGKTYAYTLYALNLSNGSILGSIPIEGQVSGHGYGSTGSGIDAHISFNALYQLNRPALLLAGNVLYVAFGSHCDMGPYHGWLFAYDVSNASTPKLIDILCTTPNGTGSKRVNGLPVEGEGGIWMSGAGPSVDSDGYIYLSTGNGSYDGITEFSDSVLKIKLDQNKLRVVDWFTASNQDQLKDDDYDLGSGGVALLPGTHTAVTGSKEGRLYLLDTADLGHGKQPPLQSFQVTHPHPPPPLAYNLHNAPVIWPHKDFAYVYVMGEEDPLKQYQLVHNPQTKGDGWKFDPDLPFKTSPKTSPYPNFPNGLFLPDRTDPIWMPGGFLSLSADGDHDGTGILWATMPYAANANHMVVRGVLRAFDASNVAKGELWDSENSGDPNDGLGQFAKFNPPTVANGKVYVATFQQETILANGNHVKAPNGDRPALVIYGLRSRKQTTPPPHR
ncbi:hypothetical protein ACFPT7_23640 [Acidicapsa dinghuensis]|uniref:Pyrrolo-quinoline quinone n=1 Tax=Acidicapsa dinghuensis TaxID=2218256 RepID=A0ABW1EN27_9BACT|nr:hypothetical protein [Acidicapsa dinghuensis]